MFNRAPAGFEPVQSVNQLLADLTVPWWITGGWAIDLAVGGVTRVHSDVDVVLLERDEHALRQLDDVELQLVVGPDGQPQPWSPRRRLIAGPDSLRLVSARLPLPTQVLLGSAVGSTWVFHRGLPTIVRPLSQAGRERYGVPYLAPEVVLLMKSMSERDKDEQDFDSAVGLLDQDQRRWLDEAVGRRWRGHRRRAGDPLGIPSEHPWASRLASHP